ncbi:hypothetical protein AC249_AIPGENE14515 [Exaiptasia diaphana]|nr:hypothetical protein AC249_AIPGENE14515 [Exaiptasia diaphana]
MTPCHILKKPCMNDGKCEATLDTHHCKCSLGLIGEQCQDGLWSPWSQWSSCLPSLCVPKRIRECTAPVPYENSCHGPAVETNSTCPEHPTAAISSNDTRLL